MAEKKTKEKRLEELSRKLGDATNTSYSAYTEDLVHTMRRTDDYIISLAFENADGTFEKQAGGDLDWETPENYGMFHVHVVVQDRDDKRFVPYLDVTVRIYDNENKLVTESAAPFVWNPYSYHYGFDTILPDDGKYSAEIAIKSPDFARNHKVHGKRYMDDVLTKLGPVEIMLPGGNEEADFITE
jgi:hypothetical protein